LLFVLAGQVKLAFPGGGFDQDQRHPAERDHGLDAADTPAIKKSARGALPRKRLRAFDIGD
jgi:hypothetical protein